LEINGFWLVFVEKCILYFINVGASDILIDIKPNFIKKNALFLELYFSPSFRLYAFTLNKLTKKNNFL